MIDERARGAHGVLMKELRPFVARRVRALHDVDDVLQDIFLRMQRALPDLRDEQRFGPWVYRIARSAIADHHRAASRHPVAAGEHEEADASVEVEPEGGAEEELAAYVSFFIATLPSPYREALTLTELEGLTQREAAEMLGISVSGMKSRVQRGRALLRRALEDCCEIALDARGRVIAYEPRIPAGSCCD